MWNYTRNANEMSATNDNNPISIPVIHADAPGNDNENLNGEYIVIQNSKNEQIGISNWEISDAAGYEYTVPTGVTIPAGGEITVYTGDGEDTNSKLYMGASRAVWNNNGDTIIIRNEAGEVVIQEKY